MRVLVTGATGFVGRHLVEALRTDGPRYALYRSGIENVDRVLACSRWLQRALAADDIAAVEFAGWQRPDAVERELQPAWAMVAPSLWAEPLVLVRSRRSSGACRSSRARPAASPRPSNTA